MTHSPVLASTLVALVSVPAFLVGHKLQHEDRLSVLLLVPLLLMIVLVASALMRQRD